MSTMVICGSYMFEFSVNNDMKNDIISKDSIGKVATHLCLTLIIKELKISVEQGRVYNQTLSILFDVVLVTLHMRFTNSTKQDK